MKLLDFTKIGYYESERRKNEIAVQVGRWMKSGIKLDEMGRKNRRKRKACKKMWA